MSIQEIVVLSRSKAKEFTCDRPWAAISISSFEGDLPKLNMCQRVDLLQLIFEDTEFNRSDCFQPEDAKRILEFVEKVKDKIEVLLVHCFAGWSRSPAVAAAIDKIFNNKNEKENMHYWTHYEPNMLVYKTIVETWSAGHEVPHY